MIDQASSTSIVEVSAPGIQPLVSPEAAAKVLGVGRSTVYTLMDSGHLRWFSYPGVRGRRIRVSDLEHLIESSQRGGWATEQH